MQVASSPDATKLLFSDGVVYVTGKIEAEAGVPKVWSHVVQSPSTGPFDLLDSMLKGSPSPLVWVRYGLIDGDTASYVDWEQHVLVSVSSAPSASPNSSNGNLVNFVTADLLYLMQKTERVTSRSGLLSDMVRSIASDAGFTQFAIEPTLGPYSLVQSFESDYSFVCSRILGYTSNADDESFYLFFARGRFLHFHTIGYQVSGVYSLEYGSVSDSVTNAMRTNRAGSNSISDASGINLVAYDPVTGRTTSWKTNADSELSLGDTRPPVGGTVFSTAHVGQNQVSALYSDAQSRYASQRSEVTDVSFVISSYPYMGVGDVVNTTFVKGQGDPWSGLYYVRKVRHQVTNGAVESFYALARGEYDSNQANVGGHIFNLAQAVSSSLTSDTTGNFTPTGGGTVVPVSSPG